jgi:DNA-3-methyladenine glycosylase
VGGQLTGGAPGMPGRDRHPAGPGTPAASRRDGDADLPGLLARSFFARRSVQVAPALLGCVLEHQTPDGLVAVALTEVEAYAGAEDPASHAYRGRTRRNGVMFGPPGYSYVYFTYGMHFCVNLVCLPAGTAEAVLLRAGVIIEGVPVARLRRPAARADTDLARGPARLCQALAIDRTLDGADVCAAGSPLRIRGPARGRFPGKVLTGPRVGVSSAPDVPWRFWIAGDPTVSVYRPSAPRRWGKKETVADPGGGGGKIQP